MTNQNCYEKSRTTCAKKKNTACSTPILNHIQSRCSPLISQEEQHCDVSFDAEGNASGTVGYKAAANQFLMQYHPHREGSPSLSMQWVMKGPIAYNTFQSFWGERWQKHNQNGRKHAISIRFLSYKDTIEHCTVHITVSQDGRRSIWIVNSCKFKMGMHYERAARSEATLQKTVAKKFLKSGDGGRYERRKSRHRGCL